MRKLLTILVSVVLMLTLGCASIPKPAPVFAGVKVEAHKLDVAGIASAIAVPDDILGGEQMQTLTGFSFNLFGLPLTAAAKYQLKLPADRKRVGIQLMLGGRIYDLPPPE